VCFEFVREQTHKKRQCLRLRSREHQQELRQLRVGVWAVELGPQAEQLGGDKPGQNPR
jgi:hypothetical protein